jgi:hypothetical protein
MSGAVLLRHFGIGEFTCVLRVARPGRRTRVLRAAATWKPHLPVLTNDEDTEFRAGCDEALRAVARASGMAGRYRAHVTHNGPACDASASSEKGKSK